MNIKMVHPAFPKRAKSDNLTTLKSNYDMILGESAVLEELYVLRGGVQLREVREVVLPH
jgi:hypothetical protein